MINQFAASICLRVTILVAILPISLIAGCGGCGKAFEQMAVLRHVSKEVSNFTYEVDPQETWEAAREVLQDAGYKLADVEPVFDQTVKAQGEEEEDLRRWADVLLSKHEDGYQLEIKRSEERRTEKVSWESTTRQTDGQRLEAVAARIDVVSRKDGDAFVFLAPAYRVWAETRQELLEAGIQVPPSDTPAGEVATPWIDEGDRRSRRVITLEELDNETNLRIEVERAQKKVTYHWQGGRSHRDLGLEMKVIERVEPERLAEIKAEARTKGQRARNSGDKIDDAVLDAIKEGVQQESAN